MAKPRSLPKPGLSLADANRGRLITYNEDVLNIKREIETRWAGLLSVFFDTDASSEEWVIVEHCKDGTEAILFTTKTLSQATIDRIQRADQASRAFEDPNQVYEQMDREEEREKERRFSEAIGEAGERLYHALRKDGLLHAPRVFLSNSGSHVRSIT